MKIKKSNAMRFLDKQAIPYQAHEYDTADGAIDGVSVAQKTGRDPAIVFKTLVCKGASGGIYVFCIPVEQELSLKNAAQTAKEKNIAMLPAKDLLAVTGYVHGGCSPIGMKRAYPTFLRESALAAGHILVSGGRIGLQIEIAPQDLIRATGAAIF